jgi:hypothetical protein
VAGFLFAAAHAIRRGQANRKGGPSVRLKHLFIGQAIVSGLNALAFLLMPAQYWTLFGVSTHSPQLILISRMFGAALLTYAVTAWMARFSMPSGARRAIVSGFGISHAVGLVSGLLAMLSNVVNALGWVIVAIYLVFTLGYAYFCRNPEAR